MEEIFDKVIRYGMFLGAIFQLVCIAAVIILPEQVRTHKDGHFDMSDSESDTNTQTVRKPHVHYRSRKQDKKKRR